ncbi:filamentous hemagglutinin N-terminal domain-containing protein [Alkalinema pantanalense CENA528]|uniref:two-partner secretion domain-containing protein n=1 Tax=Alkalinema pantanalense TaxID=1620705 RepID=UPI003D6F4938
MQFRSSDFGLWVMLGLLSAVSSPGAIAQTAPIVPDNTLPTPSQVQQQNPLLQITGGTQRGGNLFHSFERFSIPTGQTAIFVVDPALTQNIITRVTGKLPSAIDGVLGTHGGANLFFLNPNGITFGQNARLEIGGSFVASTANGYQFSDGSEFSATNPQAPPLLAVNLPLGLQFGSTPGKIVQQSPALAVAPGQTLALVGGDVLVPGGNLFAPSGRIELGSVQASGQVTINSDSEGLVLSYPNVSTLGQIQLLDGATINTSGNPSGAIQIQGRSFQMANNARILSFNLGTSDGGDLTINASDAIEIVGTGNHAQTLQALSTGALDISKASNIIATISLNSGATGRIILNTGKLTLFNGAYITNITAGIGLPSSLTINASDITLDQGLISSLTAIHSPRDSSSLTINTDRLTLQTNSFLSTTTLNSGSSGKLTIHARDRVDVVGSDLIQFPLSDVPGVTTSISTTGLGGGKAGELEINTEQLTLLQGARLSTSSTNQLEGGNLTINATDRIVLDGMSPDRTSPTTVTARSASGRGGNINLNSRQLFVTDGAVVATSTSGQDRSGNISVNSQEMVVVSGSGGGLFTNTTSESAQGGTISVTTDNFRVTDFAKLDASTTGQRGGDIIISSRLFTAQSGGRIRTSTFGRGQAGDIKIEAFDLVTLDGTGQIAPTLKLLLDGVIKGNLVFIPPVINSPNPPTGAAILVQKPDGDIKVTARQVFQLSEQQTGLFASSYAQGSGGNLTLKSPQINVSNDALVSVSGWASGNSGQLNVIANNLNIQDSLLLTSTTAGNGGKLAIAANNFTLSNGTLIAVTAQGTGATIDLNIKNLLLMRHGSQITARAFEKGIGGNIKVDAGFIVALPNENSDITARALRERGGNIQITTQGLYGLSFQPRPTLLSDITASSEFGIDGIVTINSPEIDPSKSVNELPADLLDLSHQIDPVCSQQQQANRFVVTGRGGLPPSPQEILNIPPTADTSARGDRHASPDLTREDPSEGVLIEADRWQWNADGSLSLLASQPTAAVSPVHCGKPTTTTRVTVP